jgi:hypothetical protein
MEPTQQTVMERARELSLRPARRRDVEIKL